MTLRRLSWGVAGAGALALALPSVAAADTLDAAVNGALPDSVAINSIWVVVAALLVIFMQAGFAFLEIGFSRGKNAGTVVAKILTNFSIAAICCTGRWVRIRIRRRRALIGHAGFFLRDYGDPQKAFAVMGLSDATIESKCLFQFSFCAVSLAIVWGTTLERIKFGVYIIYAVVFAGLIYPIGSHWVFGGGWLQANLGMQDFAGSTAVHLIGATGALAALLLLGARRGKYGADGKPRAIPGHNMPLFGLGVLILWLGWFGFNPGSTLGALDGRFPEVVARDPAGRRRRRARPPWSRPLEDEDGRHRHGRQRRDRRARRDHRPVGLRGPVGGAVIGLVAGFIVPLGVYAIDKKIDDPVGALTAHGLCGIWGTLSCGLFTSPALAEVQRRSARPAWSTAARSTSSARRPSA